MKVVALLAVRNEARYLERCLDHLHHQGVDTWLIDNGSTDATLEIAARFEARGLIGIEHLPFSGVFELDAQLRCKERLAAALDADWFMHCDADEIREAPGRFATLREGIEDVDRRGYNAIDFDEFVFLPTSADESFEGRDYVAAMRHYYYYEPDSPDRFRINAWKKQPHVNLRSFAGHKVVFPGLKLCPEPFVLRHYLVLSQAHAREKYGDRRFAAAELARSWHGDRAAFGREGLAWPSRDRLKLADDAGAFDTSDPWKQHPRDARATAFPAGAVSALGEAESPRRQRRDALKRFKDDQSSYIPTIDPVTMLEDRPFWSVMIPTYNGDRSHLVHALESVLIQDPGAALMQIEVVDDGTTSHDVEAIVAEAGRGRVAYHRNPERLGLPANWNRCLARARGRWIHLLHQDDEVLPGFYQRLQAPCDDTRLAAAFCRGAGMDASGGVRWVQDAERETPGIVANFIVSEAAVNRVISPSVVIRRAVFEDIGGFHLGLPYCADWDIYKRVAVYGAVWYEPACLARWRQHEASATARLAGTGADLVDRRKSIDLSQAYLPADAVEGSTDLALKTSLLWASDVLRESLVRDNLRTALAQAREIVQTLEHVSEGATRESRSQALPEDSVRLNAQIDRLETQIRAWMRAAEMLAAPRGERER